MHCIAPVAAAFVLIVGILSLHFCFAANEIGTWFMGHAFGSACWVRARFGIPCPNCGMSRSLILSAHGEFARAWRLAPGGPAMVATAALTSLILGALGLAIVSRRPAVVSKVQHASRVAVVAGTIVSTSVWLAGWGFAVMHSLRSR